MSGGPAHHWHITGLPLSSLHGGPASCQNCMQSHCQRQVLPLASNRASVSLFTLCGILGEMLTLWSPPLPLSDSMSLQNISSLDRTVTLLGHSSALGKCFLKKQNHFTSSFITKYCTSATVPKRSRCCTLIANHERMGDSQCGPHWPSTRFHGSMENIQIQAQTLTL